MTRKVKALWNHLLIVDTEWSGPSNVFAPILSVEPFSIELRSATLLINEFKDRLSLHCESLFLKLVSRRGVESLNPPWACRTDVGNSKDFGLLPYVMSAVRKSQE